MISRENKKALQDYHMNVRLNRLDLSPATPVEIYRNDAFGWEPALAVNRMPRAFSKSDSTTRWYVRLSDPPYGIEDVPIECIRLPGEETPV